MPADIIHTLEIDSITKSYNGNEILSNIYLKVQTGEICALFGRNGTGKSTLLKIIYGILAAENKFVRINDKILKNAYKHPSLISFLPQDPFFPSELKVKTILKLRNIKENIIETSLLDKIIDKRIYQLSTGEARYLEIIFILYSNAKFVLLDEPFRFLSPIWIEDIGNMIAQQAKYKGIVITDHRYQNMLDIANRILLLANRCLYKLKNADELKQKGYI